MILRAALALVLMLGATMAHAQSTPQFQLGRAKAGDIVKMLSSGASGDGSVNGVLGDLNGRGVNPFAIIDSNGLGLCSNTASTGSAHNAFCLGHDSSGNAVLSIDSKGGLADKTLNIKIGGQTIPFPGAASSVGASGILQKSGGGGIFAAYAGTACPGGQVPNGIDASGLVTGCTVPPSTPSAGSTGNLQTNAGAGAFGAYAGTACPGGQAPNGLDAAGLVTGCAAGGLSAANPSGLIGMSAVNGVAATVDRSDSRHAIDPAIVPTWTGAHTDQALHTFNGGFAGSMTNPANGNSTDRIFGSVSTTFDHTLNVNSTFSDANTLEIVQTTNWAMNSYAGGTNAKWTTIPLNIAHTSAASGQSFVTNETLTKYGGGDAFIGSRRLQFAGPPISGDEGQGFNAVSYVQQQPTLTKTTLSGVPVRSSCNTTLAQTVTGSPTVQDVSIASTAGCVDNDWVEVDTELPTATPNHEAVQITRTGVAAGKIRGIFRNNHTSGHVVTPALVVTVADAAKFGQNRVLVNLSGTSYSTGTVASISGGGLTGSSTVWTTGIVGDNGTNSIGCIALTNDNLTAVPFDGGNGPLKSWYQIGSVGSNTALGIYKTSVAADAAYNGKGVGSGGYIIRPCAEVLVVSGSTVVLATNGSTWTNGDNIELAISPYPDVSGHQEHYAVWTPGGALRRGYLFENTGARTIGVGVEINGNMAAGGGADTMAWQRGAKISETGIGLDIAATQMGISLAGNANNAVHWGSLGALNAPANQYIGYTEVNSQPGMLIHPVSGTSGVTDTGALVLSRSDGVRPWGQFNGNVGLAARAATSSTRLRFYDGSGDAQAATGLMDIRYVDSGGRSDSQPFYWASNWGLVFSSTNPNFASGHDLFVIAGDAANGRSNVVGLPELGTATGGGNFNSGTFRWEGSVWNGSAARATWAAASVVAPAGTNAHVTWALDILGDAAGCTYNASFPSRVFQVEDTGKIKFGRTDPDGCSGTTYIATFDPTALTTTRVFTIPDAAGALVIDTATQTLTKKTLTDQIDQEAHISTATISKTDTTLASITGLAQSLTAAGLYSCHGHLHFTTAPTGSNGAKIALATSDTLTVNTLEFTVKAYNAAAFVTSGVGTATALGSTAISTLNAITDLDMDAAINVNAAGTLQVQLAENTASGTIAATAGNVAWDCHRAA